MEMVCVLPALLHIDLLSVAAVAALGTSAHSFIQSFVSLTRSLWLQKTSYVPRYFMKGSKTP